MCTIDSLSCIQIYICMYICLCYTHIYIYIHLFFRVNGNLIASCTLMYQFKNQYPSIVELVTNQVCRSSKRGLRKSNAIFLDNAKKIKFYDNQSYKILSLIIVKTVK